MNIMVFSLVNMAITHVTLGRMVYGNSLSTLVTEQVADEDDQVSITAAGRLCASSWVWVFNS